MRLRSYGFFFTFPALFRKFYHDFAAIMRFSPLPTHIYPEFTLRLDFAWSTRLRLATTPTVFPHRRCNYIEDVKYL